MRWRDNNAVREIRRPPEVKREDGARDCRRRRIAAIAIDHRLYAICCEHLDGSCESRLGQRMRVFPYVQRAADAMAAAVITDRLGDR